MDKYTYRATWSKEDSEYAGLCAEFPSLSWLASTQEAALAGIRDVVQKVIQDMSTTGEPIPEPFATTRESSLYTSRRMHIGDFKYRLLKPTLVSIVLSVLDYPVNLMCK
jgi:predicted RNase H-like HicB family nuclease